MFRLRIPLIWKLQLLGAAVFLFFSVMLVTIVADSAVSVFGGYYNYEQSETPAGGSVSGAVLRFKDAIATEMKKQGLDSSWLPVLLAHVMVESGGNAEKTPDIFQASEYAGKKPNSLTTAESIHYGVACMKDAVDTLSQVTGHTLSARSENDVNLTSDYYNFSSLASWLAENGIKDWSLNEHNDFYTWARSLGAGGGDINYYKKILEYYDPSTGQLRGALTGASGQASTAVNIALAQCGKPYVWGATGPDAFDCSGLVIYAFRQAGYQISGRPTSQEMFKGNANFQRIDQSKLSPGDLIFFQLGSGGADHVGIYIGNNQMVNAETDNNPLPQQIEVVDVFSNPYWSSHIAGFGRVVK
ncbi:C40 family peptidase [Sporolactobacillus sp. KGMB 08714]|uniref:C40 family peptidase n=1 Tax=Sporolactobacillus sp. KGMB 08714 TaxID=3064704 RepID=UPI002FBF11F9